MQYRACFIDTQDAVRAAWAIRASSAAEAVARAEVFRDQAVIEVWEVHPEDPHADRLIRRIEPSSA